MKTNNKLNAAVLTISIALSAIVLPTCSNPSSPGTGPGGGGDTKVAAPTFDPPTGNYTGAQTVTIACATEGASVFYTLNGSEPAEATGTAYANPVTVSLGSTIRARAFKTGLESSEIASATYTYALPGGSYSLTSGQVETKDPCYVNILFQVQKQVAKGEVPPAIDGLSLADFTFREDGADITSESCPRISRVTDQIPYSIYTVLMLDNSGSIGANLDAIKTAAKSLVANKIPVRQYIAIYKFSDAPVLVADFSNQGSVLNSAIDSIGLGYNSTDLYNSVVTGAAKLPADRFATSSILSGSLIVLTDGVDTTHTRTLADAATACQGKKVVSIGIGSDVDESALMQLSGVNGSFYSGSDFSGLQRIFQDTQQAIINWAASFYWAYYLSPTRTGSHSLEISLKGNGNNGSGSKVSTTFPSASFYSIMPGLYVNDDAADRDGIAAIALPAGANTELRVHSYFGNYDPSYTYTFNTGSITVSESEVSSTAAEERMYFRPAAELPDGSTLTIADTENSYSAGFSRTIAIARPSAPVISSVAGGIGQAIVSWDAVPGAESYNVYYSQGDSASPATGTKIAGASSPRIVAGLANGTQYAFVVTAVNAVGESAASPVATTTAELPSPLISSVQGSNGQATVSWNGVTGATSYNLYYRAGTSVTTTTGTKVTGATSPCVVTGLPDNACHAFIVTAANESGESAPSSTMMGWTSTPVPAISSVIGGDGQATISWDGVAGAAAYSLYYRSGTSVTTGNGTKIIGASSPRTITGLSSGTQYSFILTATNSGSTESPASAVASTWTRPSAPAIGSISGAAGQATVSWSAVTGATSYNLYYHAGTSVTTTTGTKVSGVTSPYAVTGLSDNTNYAFIVTAANEGGESAASSIGTAWTSTPVPAISSVVGGDAQAMVSWNEVEGATSYSIYYRYGTSVTTGNGTKIPGATSPYTVTGLSRGRQYSFIVTATNNAAIESPASAIASAWTLTQAPASVYAYGYRGQATVSWAEVTGATSYNLYYRAGTSVTTTTGTKVTVATSPCVVEGLPDNTCYAFIVTAANESGESPPSSIKTVWTSSPVPAITSVVGGDGRATLSWDGVAGAESYSIYYRSGASVTTGNGTRISGATSPRAITGLASGTQYSFIVTATNGGATESPSSAIASTRTRPAAPSISSVIWSGDQATVSWDSVADASVYNIYYAAGTSVTTATGTKVGGATSPRTITGLVAGSQYAFIVTAENESGEGSPSWVSLASSSAGTSWTARSLPSSRQWMSVTYGNGIFVAVAADGTSAATSPDGITWTARSLPSSQQWSSVTCGNGMFVAIAFNSAVAATSSDGITWTARSLPSSQSWRSVTYANGAFVAVAENSSAATSTDGMTWTARSLPILTNFQYWWSVTYGNGVFVAVAASCAVAATSPDGITWTARSLPSVRSWYSVAYGNGVFVAFASSYAFAATSPDGISWTARSLPGSENWQSATYGNGIFVVVAANSATAATSSDGISWTARSLPSSANWQSVTYGNGVFVTVDIGSSAAATSP